MKMPGHDGLWLLENFRERHPDTSVIMLTGYGDTEAAVDCLRRGAVDYLLKPPKLTDLIRAIERALAKRRIELARKRYQKKLESARCATAPPSCAPRSRDIANTYQNTLLALVAALDAREHETSDHSQRVVQYTRPSPGGMGINGAELEEIGRGALLHDIGKIGVPDAVLLKPGKLTPDEWVEMRKHPEHRLPDDPGASPSSTCPRRSCSRTRSAGTATATRAASQAQEIHIGARIFAVADTLDAMTSDRPYRRRGTSGAAREEIERCAGTQFDPRCARSCRCRRASSPSSRARRRPGRSDLTGAAPRPSGRAAGAPPLLGGSLERPLTPSVAPANRARSRGARPLSRVRAGSPPGGASPLPALRAGPLPRLPPRMIWTAPIGYKGRVSQPDAALPVTDRSSTRRAGQSATCASPSPTAATSGAATARRRGRDHRDDPLTRRARAPGGHLRRRRRLARVRLTGGEPMVRGDLADGVRESLRPRGSRGRAHHQRPPPRRAGRAAARRRGLAYQHLARHPPPGELPRITRPARRRPDRAPASTRRSSANFDPRCSTPSW